VANPHFWPLSETLRPQSDRSAQSLRLIRWACTLIIFFILPRQLIPPRLRTDRLLLSNHFVSAFPATDERPPAHLFPDSIPNLPRLLPVFSTSSHDTSQQTKLIELTLAASRDPILVCPNSFQHESLRVSAILDRETLGVVLQFIPPFFDEFPVFWIWEREAVLFSVLGGVVDCGGEGGVASLGCM